MFLRNQRNDIKCTQVLHHHCLGAQFGASRSRRWPFEAVSNKVEESIQIQKIKTQNLSMRVGVISRIFEELEHPIPISNRRRILSQREHSVHDQRINRILISRLRRVGAMQALEPQRWLIVPVQPITNHTINRCGSSHDRKCRCVNWVCERLFLKDSS